MFDIIRHKDMTPYASGLRWYKLRMSYDGNDTAIFSDDFDQVYGQSGEQLPTTITGPAVLNYFGTPAILNFVAVDVMVIPTQASIEGIQNVNFSPAFLSIGGIDGSLKSEIQLNPSPQYGFPEIDIYVQGIALNEAVYDTSNL